MVKYADAPSAEVEAEITAAPSAVWAHLVDISLPARFSDEFQGAEWLDDAGPALGARFRGHNKHPKGFEWHVECLVTAFEPDSVFEWTVGDPANKVARWRFDLAPTTDGSTLRFSAEMGPGPSGLTPAIERMPDREDEIVERRLDDWRANMRRTVDGIAALAEGRDPAS
ncbi:MAG: SRPBCC family protein [Actinomycetota bacterium]